MQDLTLLKYIHSPQPLAIYLETTAGLPYTGLTYNTEGLAVVSCPIGMSVQLSHTLANLTNINSNPVDNGFKEISSTYFPGWYRYDAQLKNGYQKLGYSWLFCFYGATNLMRKSFILTSNYDEAPIVVNYVSAVGNVNGNVVGNILGTAENITAPLITANNETKSLVSAGFSGILQPTAMQLPPEEEV